MRLHRLALVVTLLCLTAAVQATAGPGRVAIGGVFPTGYVGTLARYGLPRDVLFDAQMTDSAVLSRYQVIIVAGMPDDAAALRALENYLAKGGRVLLDLSSQRMAIPGVMAPERGGGGWFGAPQLNTTVGMSRSPMRAVANSPLAPDLLAQAAVATGDDPRSKIRPGGVPDQKLLTNPVVLAEYTATISRPAPGERPLDPRERLRGALNDNGPAAPAVVMGTRGAGRVVLCGPMIGMASSLMGADYDALVLGMLRVISDGRCVPQLDPEGPRLGRKESLRSQGETDTEVPDAPQADSGRPDGPGQRSALPAGVAELAADQPDEYNVTGKLGASPSELLLHYWNASNLVKVTVSANSAQITRISGGSAKVLEDARLGLAPGTPCTVKMRVDKLLLTAGTTYLSADLTGVHRGSMGARGFQPPAELQQVESVYFADDFMRTNDSQGGWETLGGTWQTAPVQNPDMGANPFSYKVDTPAGPAVALQGSATWDEYKYTCAVRPTAAGGQVGLGWYARDAKNMYLFRAAVRTDEKPVTKGLALVKLVDGKETVLAESDGGFANGQWYRVMVKAEGPWLGVFVDGQKVFGAKDTTFDSGKVALGADHTSARFDDVEVESVVIAAQQGQELRGKVPDFAGIIDVDSWAGPATVWEPDPDTGGLFWRRNAFFGDVNLRYDIAKLPDGGAATLIVDGDGRSLNSGLSLDIKRTGKSAQVELRRAGQSLGSATTAVGDTTAIEIERKGSRVVGLVEGKALISGDAGNTGSGRLAFRAEGYKPRVSGLTLWSQNLRDYTFDSAPVDWWVGSGDWDVTNRWSCTPDWSWFGGVSKATGDQTACIWNKQEYAGDVVVDYYAGPKMLGGPNVRDFFGQQKTKERNGDLNCVICGDGLNAKSGYSFIVCPEGGGASILRQGVAVASNPNFRLFTRAHNRWANMRAERHGATVQLFVDGQVVVQYTDANPLPGGYVGVWTQDNGIMVPRVTIAFEKLGQSLLSLR